MYSDWNVSFCKSGEVLFYYNTVTGEVKWPHVPDYPITVHEQHPHGQPSDRKIVRSIETQTDLSLLHVTVVSRDTQTEGTDQEPASDSQAELFSADNNDMEDNKWEEIQGVGDNDNTESGLCGVKLDEIIQPAARNCSSASFTLEKGDSTKTLDMLSFEEMPTDSLVAKGCDTNSKSHCSTNNTVTTAVRYETSLNSLKENPFQCKECAKCFKQQSDLTSHIRIHSVEKRYECKECGRRFKRSDGLTRHGRTHTGEKPFQCKHCEKRFRYSHSLARHVRNYTL